MSSFKNNSKTTLINHGLLLDKAFKFIINNAIPKFAQPYFSHIGQDPSLTHAEIKRFNKMTKYQQTEYLKERPISVVDEIALRLNPSKKQIDFLIQYQFAKEKQIKDRIIEGVKVLLDARDIIRKSILEFVALREGIIKSKIYADNQMVNTIMKEIINPRLEPSPYDIFNITRDKEAKIEIDFTNDVLLGPFVGKSLTAEERKIVYPYEVFTMNQ